MKKNLIPGLALALLTGCVATSVYPYYTAKDVIFDAALLGVWYQADENGKEGNQWQFAQAGDNAYRFTFKDANETVECDARLFRLGGRQYLDFCPVERHGDFVPPHYLMRVVEVGPKLKLALLDYAWLGNLVKENPKVIRHIFIEEKPGDATKQRLVLTADTAELRAFILKHADDKDAFGEKPIELMRRRSPSGGQK